MQLYSDINNIPVKNWDNIQKSFISGKPDLSYLVKSGKIKKKHYNLLYETYKDLLYQLPKLNIELNKLFETYKLQHLKHQAFKLKNKCRKLKDFKEIKLSTYPTDKAFYNYLEELQKGYTDFEFSYYKISDTFEEDYKRIFNTKIPKEFSNKWEFYHAEEFMFEMKNLDIIFQLNFYAGYEKFIEVQNIKINNIHDVNKRLSEFYIKELKEPEKWFEVRFDYFDLKKLKFKANKENSIFLDVLNLGKYYSQNLDVEKLTVGQMYQAFDEIGRQNKEINKPKASGNRE